MLETIERRLDFIDRSYEPWLVMASLTPWLLSLAINSLIDSDVEGGYRVNHPIEFVIITAVMIGITYGSLKFSTMATVRELQALLHDLRAETLEATSALVPVRRRARVKLAFGVVLLVLGVVAGLVLWLANT
jgi:hypothetical protein